MRAGVVDPPVLPVRKLADTDFTKIGCCVGGCWRCRSTRKVGIAVEETNVAELHTLPDVMF